MKIQPTKMESVQLPPKAKPQSPPDAGAPDVKTDQLQLTTGRNERMKAALMNEPAVRPEVIERAKRLADDPNYPSPDILAKIAEKFIAEAKSSQ